MDFPALQHLYFHLWTLVWLPIHFAFTNVNIGLNETVNVGNFLYFFHRTFVSVFSSLCILCKSIFQQKIFLSCRDHLVCARHIMTGRPSRVPLFRQGYHGRCWLIYPYARVNKQWDPSIHVWCYSPFRALASLIRRLHSSLFATLLLHPLIPSSCRASLWTTPTHLALGFPTGLVIWKFLFKTLFGILCSSILIICPAHSSLLNLMPSMMFGSLYRL